MNRCGKITVWVLTLTTCATTMGQVPPPPGAGTTVDVKQPRLFVAERTVDLGEVIEGHKTTFHWVLGNKGTGDLIIDRTKVSCGCTVVKLKEEDKVIPPGESLNLVVVFDSAGRRGHQKKFVNVDTNDPAEPRLTLEFTATVKQLFRVDPARVLNARSLRRGDTIPKTIDVQPSASGASLEVLGVEFVGDAPMTYTMEPLRELGAGATRIRLSVQEDAAIGTINGNAVLKLKVNGEDTDREILIRGKVVGDLVVQPRVLDATRQVSTHGKRLAPVTVRGTPETEFKVVSASAGPVLDIACAPGKTKNTIVCTPTIAADAPAGPFGTTIEIRTDSLDQPVIQVPVYGNVAEIVKVVPPMVLFRNNNTPSGMTRRVKLQAAPQVELDIQDIRCDIDGVEYAIDMDASERYIHLRYLQIKLQKGWSGNTREGVVTVTTSTPGAETINIPVMILP